MSKQNLGVKKVTFLAWAVAIYAGIVLVAGGYGILAPDLDFIYFLAVPVPICSTILFLPLMLGAAQESPHPFGVFVGTAFALGLVAYFNILFAAMMTP